MGEAVVPEGFASYLADALVGAVASFSRDDELAYLALTGKVENCVRDRVAWALCNSLPDLVVAREWRRRDLAILEPGGKCLAIVEAKAMYSFDAIFDPALKSYQDFVLADISKAHAADSKADVFAVVLVTDIDGDPEAPSGVVKYAKLIRRFRDEIGMLAGAAERIKETFGHFGPVKKVCSSSGRAFKADVTVECWLIGPTI